MTNIISGIRTFYKSPIMDDTKKYGIVGVPYDAGCTFNRGAAFGPSAVRDASTMLCDGVDANTGVDVMKYITDLGDVEFDFDAFDYSKNPLKQFDNYHLITVGGDHGIATMTIQRMFEQYGKIQLVHFDAHSDAWDGPSNHGTFIRQVVDADWISNLTQIGIRSPSPIDVQDYVKDNKIKSFSSFDVNNNMTAVLNHLYSLQDIPTYITFDIDVLEPSYIGNGTGTPEPFGLTPMQVYTIFTSLIEYKKNHIKGMDIVEVSPPLDSNNLSSIMASNIIWKYIAHMEW